MMIFLKIIESEKNGSKLLDSALDGQAGAGICQEAGFSMEIFSATKLKRSGVCTRFSGVVWQLCFQKRHQTRDFVVSSLRQCCLLACLSLTMTSVLLAQPGGIPDEAPVVIRPESGANTGNTADPRRATGETKTFIPTNPAEALLALNWWGIPFGLATLICIWFTTERLVVLRRARVIPKPFVERFLHHLREGSITPEEALKLCEENGSPVAKIFAHGVRKWGKPSVEVEQAIIDGGERQVSELRKHLRVLNGIATICPLIGLLGTVWGMIVSFTGIATAAMGSTEKLAAGIALALLTTVAGLVIAIPAMVIYLYLSGRVDERVMEMDRLAQEVVYSISAEALHEMPKYSKLK